MIYYLFPPYCQYTGEVIGTTKKSVYILHTQVPRYCERCIVIFDNFFFFSVASHFDYSHASIRSGSHIRILQRKCVCVVDVPFRVPDQMGFSGKMLWIQNTASVWLFHVFSRWLSMNLKKKIVLCSITFSKIISDYPVNFILITYILYFRYFSFHCVFVCSGYSFLKVKRSYRST